MVPGWKNPRADKSKVLPDQSRDVCIFALRCASYKRKGKVRHRTNKSCYGTGSCEGEFGAAALLEKAMLTDNLMPTMKKLTSDREARV